MNQLKRVIQLIEFCVIILGYCSAVKAQDNTDTKKMAVRQLQPLIIDGKENDWPPVLPYEDEQAGISYSISNNDSVLYICLKPKNDITQAKILIAGLTIYFNPDEKKRQRTSLMFPQKSGDNVAQSNDLKTMEMLAMMNANEYTSNGFSKANGTYAKDQKNDAGISVMIGVNEKGELIYETAIPFAAFYTKQKIGLGDCNKPIAVGIFINAISRPDSSPGLGVPGPSNARTNRKDLENIFSANSKTRPGKKEMQQLYENSKTWKVINLAL